MQEIPIDKIDDFPNNPFKVRIASFVFGGEPALKLSSLSCTGVGDGSQVYGLEFVGAFGFLVVCYLPPSPGWLPLSRRLSGCHRFETVYFIQGRAIRFNLRSLSMVVL